MQIVNATLTTTPVTGNLLANAGTTTLSFGHTSPADLRIPADPFKRKVWVDPDLLHQSNLSPRLALASPSGILLPHTTVEKVTKETVGFRDSLRLDAIARLFGDGLKGVNYWLSNVARFNNGETQTGTTHQLWNAESGLAGTFLPASFQTSTLSPDQAARLIDIGGAVGGGNNAIKSFFYCLNLRGLSRSIKTAESSSNHDAVSQRNTLAKLKAERLRVYGFLAEKGFNLASWASVSATLGFGLGWKFGAAMLVGGHFTNLLGLSAQMVSAVKALGEGNHTYARQQMLNPLLSPERTAKNLAEKISAHEKSSEGVRAEIKDMLAAIKTDAVDQMVVAVTAHKNEVDAAEKQNWFGRARSFLKSFWNRDSRTVDTATPSGEGVVNLRKELTAQTASRIQRLMQLELELTGETSLPVLEESKTAKAKITDAANIPSSDEITFHLNKLETPTSRKGRIGAESTASLVRAFEAPGKMALSVAALYYAAKALLPDVSNSEMVAKAAEAGASEAANIDVFNILSGAHTIPDLLTAAVLTTTVIGPGLAFLGDVRELRKAAGDFLNGDESSADNVYYYSVGAATSAIIASGAALSASPITRPFGMLIGASGMGAMVLGKFLFYKYKSWRSYQALRDAYATVASPVINLVLRNPFKSKTKPQIQTLQESASIS